LDWAGRSGIWRKSDGRSSGRSSSRSILGKWSGLLDLLSRSGAGLSLPRIAVVLMCQVGDGIAAINQEWVVGKSMIWGSGVPAEGALEATRESMFLILRVLSKAHPISGTFVEVNFQNKVQGSTLVIIWIWIRVRIWIWIGCVISRLAGLTAGCTARTVIFQGGALSNLPFL
jgi:hypothetical protein